jgi:predicted dehydrogenase
MLAQSLRGDLSMSSGSIGIGVIGYGYWGPNLVRNFIENPGTTVVGVSDMRAERLAQVTQRYPTVEVTTDYRDLLNNPKIDAIAIATPVSSHYALALEALQAGKHVFVEKPLTRTSEEAMHLIEEAEKRGLVLMVDHTFIYTGAVRKIRELISTGDLGEIYYYDSMRINLGLFQHDVDVLWDLAVHDLSIMSYVLNDRPYAVSATGLSHVPGRPENIAYLTLFFESNLIAHINVNWLAPVKVRQTLIGGSSKMVVYDDLEASEKIKIYDKGITMSDESDIHQAMIGYRTGDMWAPKIPTLEALRLEAEEFERCIREKSAPTTDGHMGLQVVRILEAATRSMRDNGQLAMLNGELQHADR